MDGYNSVTATNRYLSRRARVCSIDRNPDLRAYVTDRLRKGLTPELIAIRLRKYGHLEGISHINHESIYQWLYKPFQIKQKLHKLLCRAHAKKDRKKRVNRSTIPHCTTIHERVTRFTATIKLAKKQAERP